jgi:hypothetical protein
MVFETDRRRTDTHYDSPQLTDAERERLATTLGLAFREHANWRAVIENPDRRVRALTRFFRFMGAVIAQYGFLFVVPDREHPVGYITFLPLADREQISMKRIIRAGVLADALSFVATLRPREILRMQGFNRLVQEHERTTRRPAATETRAHLYFTGIEPGSMGKGIMRRAFASAEAQLSELGFSGYVLETTDPANLPVYERFGLDLIATEPIPGSDREIYFFEKLEIG